MITPRKLQILMTNDDGIFAPGLKHLWTALQSFADITIVAPSSERSGAGLGITLKDPLHIEQVEWEGSTAAWQVSGTPADCIRMASSVILKSPPDLIVSGINRGSNAGRNVLYSGTIAGVIEGILRNIPGIAFSCIEFDRPDYAGAQSHIIPIVNYLLSHPLPQGTFLNVNFPKELTPFKGFRMARQGRGYWTEKPDKRHHPEGNPYYWHGIKWDNHDEVEESDVLLLRQGFATVVPIHVNELTDQEVFQARKDAFEKMLSR